MMKRRTLWSMVLLCGVATTLLSTRAACGQTTFVYYPPVYRTTYYSPTAVYYPAYPAYRPTFFQAFFGPLAGYNYYPTYTYPTAYYPARTRTSYYVPSVVGDAPATPCPTACVPCGTSACPDGQCGTNYDGSSSAAGKQKRVPVPDGNASKSSAGRPRTYSEQKPPLPGTKSKSPAEGKSGKGTKKSDGLPSGDSPFKPTRPRKESGASPAFPGPDTSDTGSPRKIEARKLAPPVVIQQRKDKRPPVTEPADDETDPFDQKTEKPGPANGNKPKQSDTTSPGKKPAEAGTTGTRPTAEVRPLHLDDRVTWRMVPRRTRLSVRSVRFGTPTVDRAFRSNRGWVPVPSGDRVAGP